LNGIAKELALYGPGVCDAKELAEPHLTRGIGRTVKRVSACLGLEEEDENETSREMARVGSRSAGATVSQTD
jgi:hypothetical protein